ncbi:FMN-binding protein [Haloplasma contractile]|uniref:Fumarate reductase flavoprotein subunit n=1 Tax=Haloplasma contractile SSD-17B TaxID=1033810 RepID=U2EA45_9MOLU|nr:FMN-binding protein [Haloplasma contractile]ERJ11988.1 fumarate reductase flavoprotein subunit [Haloplasma contractile SSD-17B]
MMAKKIMLLIVTLFTLFLTLSIGGLTYLHYGQKEVNKTIVNDVDLTTIEDGVYIGEFEGHRWSNKVKVDIDDHKIVDIITMGDQLFNDEQVKNELFEQVIEEQSVDVDVVSGATISSKAYLKAIENALKNG